MPEGEPVTVAQTAQAEVMPREVAGQTSALARPTRRNVGSKQDPLVAELPEHLQRLRFPLVLCVPVPGFTLRRLQELTAGAILVTEHSSSRDLVLRAAGERLMQVELEAVETQLAARVKRLL